MSHGPARIAIEPEKLDALRKLVSEQGMAAAARQTGMGRLALSSALAMGTLPAAQAALLEKAFGVGPLPRSLPSTLALRTGGRPF